MTIDRNKALSIAETIISNMPKDDPIIILADYTIEVDRGWLFFYNSVDFIKNGDESAALAGNGPILVDRDGRARFVSSAVPWQEAIENSRFLSDADQYQLQPGGARK